MTTLFAEYKEIKNYSAIKWTTKAGSDPATAREISGPIYAPYNDVYRYGGLEWRAPKNKHRSVISESWAAGAPRAGGGSNCTEMTARTKELFPNPIKVLYRSNQHTARITGYLDPVKAYERITDGKGGFPQREVDELPQEEITKLLSGLTVVAKGPKKTFKAPVRPDGAKHGWFTMEIPGRYYGRYKLKVKAPKGISADPSAQTVRIKPGVEERADWEMGYDCKVNPPGMSFAPRREHYVDSKRGGALGVELLWNCRARAGRLRVHVTRLNQSATNFNFKCADKFNGDFWATGVPGKNWIESHTVRLLPSGEIQPSQNVYVGVFDFKGLFANANLFRASIRSADCGYDIGEQLRGSGDQG